MEEIIREHYKENYDTLVKRARRSLGDYHLGEDCVQETYERALRYYKPEDNPNFSAWVSRVLFTTTLKYLTFIRTKGMNDDAKLVNEVIFPPEFISDFKDYIATEIERTSLKPKIKEVLFLYLIKGYSAEEVNVMTSMSEYALRAHVKRFKKTLKDKVDELR